MVAVIGSDAGAAALLRLLHLPPRAGAVACPAEAAAGTPASPPSQPRHRRPPLPRPSLSRRLQHRLRRRPTLRPLPPPRDRPGAERHRQLLSPVVRRLNENRINPDDIVGTGPAGASPARRDGLHRRHRWRRRQGTHPAAPPAETLRRRPLCRAAPPAAAGLHAGPRPASLPAPGECTVVRLSKIRKLTGDHMVMSKSTSPHAFSVVEVDFANVDATRLAVKDAFKSAEGSASRTCRSSPGRSSTVSRVPTPQRQRRQRRAARAPLRRPRHRRRPRLRGSPRR